MSSFEFGGMLYRNSAEMHHAIAEQWLSAHGLNSTAQMYESLEQTDEALADECIDNWELREYEEEEEYVDLPGGEVDVRMVDKPTDFSREALIRAFAYIRENFHELYLDDDR